MKNFLSLLLLLFFILKANSFSLLKVNTNTNNCNKILNTNNIKNNNIIMDYSKFKNFDDIINILPEFHTRIIINNWLKYIEPTEIMKDYLITNYDNDNDNNNDNNDNDDHDKNENSVDIKSFPEYLIKSLYDFKIFIAINRDETNIIYFGWCPETILEKSKLAYILAGKVYNNTIFIHRIAQNPYYDNILNINSLDVVKCLENIDYREGEKFIFNYDRLHEYDNRFNISWNYYKNNIF